jgi:hypothetical protein
MKSSVLKVRNSKKLAPSNPLSKVQFSNSINCATVPTLN